MIFFQRISNGIRAMVRGGTMPFSRAKAQFTQLRTNNIFTQTAQRFRMLQNRFGYYMEVPKRYLGISGKGYQPNAKPNAEKESEHEHEDDFVNGFRRYELGSNVEQMHRRLQRKQRNADFALIQQTQVHLLDRMSGQREIFHLGFGSGRTKAQYIVNHEPLIFAQAESNTPQSENTILISSPSPEVLLNGFPLTGTTSLLPGSELNIRGRRYKVDLQFNDQITAQAYIHAVWDTDIGPVRRENEDAVGIYRGDDVYLFAVADGVGAGYSGDSMSAYTINYLLSAINLNHNQPIPWDDIIYKATQNANIEVRNFLRKIQQHGGTTLTTVLIDGWTALILHVGDSRLYLFRNGILQQITDDHIEEMIPEANAETPNKAEKQFKLSKAIGKSNRIEPDLMTLGLQPDDRLLLCTDGITGRIDDNELLQLLIDIPISKLPRELIKLSNERNNTDNASVVVLDILDHQTRDTEWEAKSKPRVYTGDSSRLIELRKIEKNNVEKKNREQEASSDDEENELGCSCLVLSLLIIIFIFGILGAWGKGFLSPSSYSIGDTITATPNTEAELQIEASSTPAIVNTVTLAPRPTRSDNLGTQESLPASTPAAAQAQVTIIIVSPTAIGQFEMTATSTVRPMNPPR